jgi:LuxR family maltose regulon positive regulatory protein
MERLILSKLVIPRIQNHVIYRANLSLKLNNILRKQLTLIVAPAGYGKTTAICSWISRKQFINDDIWLSLSEDENEPVKFWTYFFGAIERVHPSIVSNIFSLFKTNSYGQIRDSISLFINNSFDVDSDLYIFLDDFQCITNKEVQNQFNFLISHLGKSIHIVVLSRVVPEFFTPRINLSSESQLVQAEDLKFTEKEVAIFFDKNVGSKLSMEETIKINEITEGWIALIALLAEIIKEDKDWINNYHFEQSTLFEYLEKEMFDSFSETVQKFLIMTSIFEGFNSQMCDKILNLKHSKEIIRDMDKQRLVSYSYEKGHHCYKYSHMLSEFLQFKLDTNYPELKNVLLTNTSIWYEEKNDIHQAINYSLKANNVMRTIELLKRNLEDLIQDGLFQTIVKTVDRLPKGSVATCSYTAMMYSFARLFSGCFEDYDTCLKLNGIVLDTDVFEAYKNEISCIRAISFHNKGMIEASMEAIKLIDKEQFNISMMNGVTEFFEGNNYRLMGHLDKALDCFNVSLEKSKRFANIHLLLASINDLAFTNYLLGKLEKASRLYKEGILIVKSHGKVKNNIVNMLYFGLANISFEMNNIGQSLDFLLKSMEISAHRGDANFIMQGKLLYSKIMFLKGDQERCFEFIEEACLLAKNKRLKLILCRRISDLVRMLICLDKQPYAINLMDAFEVNILNDLNYQTESGHIAIADSLIHQGDHVKALDLLEKLELEAKKCNRVSSLLNILILEALANTKEDRKDRAILKLKEALRLAYGKSFCNTFLIYGQPVAEMLAVIKFKKESKESRFLSEYCYKLLKDYGQQPTKIKSSKEHTLFEMLTNRENEVLNYLCMGLSNAEIMDKMCVSINTVKKHIQNIFQKLEVENRVQALQAAGRLKTINE